MGPSSERRPESSQVQGLGAELQLKGFGSTIVKVQIVFQGETNPSVQLLGTESHALAGLVREVLGHRDLPVRHRRPGVLSLRDLPGECLLRPIRPAV